MNEHLTRQAIRNDLDWVVKAPPLLAKGPLFDFDGEVPEVPDDDIDALIPARSSKLGSYFEALALTLLKNHPDYRVLANNLPLHHNGRTLGEVDLLLINTKTDQILHLELALKFYLWTDGDGLEQGWIGAGLHDFFPKKLNRLLDHQLPIAQIAQSLGAWPEDLPKPDVNLLWMPGRLYLPKNAHAGVLTNFHNEHLPLPLNPALPISHWMEVSDAQQSDMRALAKAEWMTGQSFTQVHRELPAQFQTNQQALPLYVLPNGWQTAAQQKMKSYYLSL